MVIIRTTNKKEVVVEQKKPVKVDLTSESIQFLSVKLPIRVLVNS